MLKKRNRYRNYISIQVLAVIGVMASFQLIADRQIASLFATSFFLMASVAVLLWERKYPNYYKNSSFLGTLLFLVIFIVPIFLMRVTHWGEVFNTIEVFGVSGKWMHETSNKAFLLLMVCYFADSFMEQKRTLLESQSPESKGIIKLQKELEK